MAGDHGGSGPRCKHCRRGVLAPTDVSSALQRQNVSLAGEATWKIGDKDYTLAMNNSPDVIETINAFPIKQVDGRISVHALTLRTCTTDFRCR